MSISRNYEISIGPVGLDLSTASFDFSALNELFTSEETSFNEPANSKLDEDIQDIDSVIKNYLDHFDSKENTFKS